LRIVLIMNARRRRGHTKRAARYGGGGVFVIMIVWSLVIELLGVIPAGPRPDRETPPLSDPQGFLFCAQHF